MEAERRNRQVSRSRVAGNNLARRRWSRAGKLPGKVSRCEESVLIVLRVGVEW